MKYTIFSIDNHTDWHTSAKFMRYVDEITAMNKVKGNFIQCVGSWENTIEPSFICRTDDFLNYLLPSGYLDNQSCVLQVSECNKQYAQLLSIPDLVPHYIGSLKCVPKEEALKHSAWTYRPDINQYWITVKENPDRYQ
jgi:hypothetical protein